MNLTLQNNTQPTLPAPDRLGAMPTSAALAILGQSKRAMIVSFLVLATLFWVLALTLVKPSYVATSALLIHENQQQQPISSSNERTSDVVTTDLVAIRTQLDVLQSRDLARNVVREAHLSEDSYFAPTISLTQTIRESALAMIRSVSPDLAEALDRPAPPETAQDREESLVDRLIGLTSFINDGRSYVVTIRVKASPNAHADAAAVRALAARIANTYAEAYAAYTRTLGSEVMQQINGAVDNRLQSLLGRLTETENAVQVYRATSGLVDPQGTASGTGATLLGQQVARMNEDLATAAAESALRDAAVAALQRSGSSTIADALNSVTIGHLREQRATVSAQLASLLQRSGPNFPAVLALRTSLADVDAAIGAEVARVNQGAKTAAATAHAHEAEVRRQLALLQDRYAEQQTKQADLIVLQHKADAARSVYDVYLRRSSETASAAQMENSNIVITSHAKPPLYPAPPTALHFGLAGTMAAALFSGVVPLLRHRSRKTFRTLEELEAATGLPVLGLVPRMRNLSQRITGADADRLNEALASVRALLRLRATKQPQVIMVTSALACEGKTMLASAIARNAAAAGQRVLLVDCDLRQPSVLSLNKNESRLQPEGPGKSRFWEDQTSRLQVTALKRGDMRPQDFLASLAVRQFFDFARKTFDLVVVDTPPTLLVSDTRVLAQHADAAVLVIDWSSTHRACVVETIKILEDSGYTVAGTIPNRITPAAMNRLYGALANVRQRYKAYPITVVNP